MKPARCASNVSLVCIVDQVTSMNRFVELIDMAVDDSDDEYITLKLGAERCASAQH